MQRSGRAAIVTGSSRGIGRAAALRLANDGFNVLVNYVGNAEAAADTARQAEAFGVQAVTFQADVADATAVAAMFDLAEAEFGGIDVVVNSAGKRVNGPIADYDLATLDDVHRTNIRGTFVVCQQAVRRLRPGGAIINLSSTALRRAVPGSCAYIMSKAAIEAMNLVLARELAGRDISINSVAPGPTMTDLFSSDKTSDAMQQLADLTPHKRIGDATDIADLIAYLAGPGHWINGQAIHANGGLG
jgi:3-oxoacyl-[acyl-carrier protein] reductase